MNQMKINKTELINLISRWQELYNEQDKRTKEAREAKTMVSKLNQIYVSI